MFRFLSFALVALLLVCSSRAELRFTPFANGDLDNGIFVNVYVIDDGTTAMVMEGSRDDTIAPVVKEFIDAEGLNVQLLWISHAHPDHWFGVPIMAGYWPDAKLQVASEGIKGELTGFQGFLASVGALPSYANFDFANNLEVLEGSTISLFGPKDLIEVRVYDIIGESAYASVLYHEASQTLLTGDIVYNEVMLYMGVGVTLDSTHNWRNVLLPSLLAFYPKTETVLPGHGPSSNNLQDVVDDAQEFIRTFERTLLSCDDDYNHPSIEEVVETLRNEYSSWNQGLWIDSDLSPVGNTAWVTAQQGDVCIYPPDSDRSAGSLIVAGGLVCLVAGVLGFFGL